MQPSNSNCSDSDVELKFGDQLVWQVKLNANASVTSPNQEPVDSIAEAVASSLENPIEFPSLDQAVLPGDQLVLPVDPAIPALQEVVCGVVQWFVGRGTSPENIQVVLASDPAGQISEFASKLSATIGSEIGCEVHDPDDPEAIAYLAANEASDPIYVNRKVVDADVVFPITCGRSAAALDYLGGYSIFPLLSDRKTRGTFYRLSSLGDPKAHRKLTDWADQAATWTGFMASIAVVPAGDKQVANILAGAIEPLANACKSVMEESWTCELPERDLVIALVDGGAAHQDWLGIARALYTADRCCSDHGAIVVCSETQAQVGKSLQRLRDPKLSSLVAEQKISNDTSDDAIAASLIQKITEHKHVYLVSGHRAATLESIGVGAVADATELQHLIQQFGSCHVLGAAQHLGVTAASNAAV